MRGVISYASQEPWLFNGSVKQNILFNLPLDTERYKQVYVCNLSEYFYLISEYHCFYFEIGYKSLCVENRFQTASVW